VTDLFEHAARRDERGAPLAERMRPRSLDDFFGQEHILGAGKMLRRLIEADRVPSMILWGPPGTGKTTLARVIAHTTGAEFIAFSAVLGGVAEIREIVKGAERRRDEHQRRTILFVDEIHRFNKAQQDALLPHVERGTVTLIGATTENPSFEVVGALLSRCRVFALRALADEEIRALLERALGDAVHGLGAMGLTVDAAALDVLSQNAFGDARRALGALEAAAAFVESRARGEGVQAGGDRAKPNASPTSKTIDVASAQEALAERTLVYDKSGDEHYNVVSAFIKSMRGSDPDAALYYLARMLEASEDVRFVARRLVIFAAEDVGNADPQALSLAVAAMHAVQFIGMPEALLPLAQVVVYVALAPKSNSALTSYAAALDDVRKHGALPVPAHLRNAPTKLMRDLGYGAGYQYPHNFEGHYVAEEYLPEALRGRRFYVPSKEGAEAAMAKRLEEQRTRASADPTPPPPRKR
jgi:putative ATPase